MFQMFHLYICIFRFASWLWCLFIHCLQIGADSTGILVRNFWKNAKYFPGKGARVKGPSEFLQRFIYFGGHRSTKGMMSSLSVFTIWSPLQSTSVPCLHRSILVIEVILGWRATRGIGEEIHIICRFWHPAEKYISPWLDGYWIYYFH